MSAREKIIPVFVPHLGCPNDCVFCNQRKISGTQKPAEPADVRIAVEEGLSKILKGNVKGPEVNVQLAFYGGSFTAIPEEEQNKLLSTASEYLERGDIDSIRLSTRPDAIDEETLVRLKYYGVGTIEIGAQSMSDEVLKLSGRGHSAGDVSVAAELIKKAGFRLILQMMTGLPGDSAERSIETAGKIISLKPDGVRIYPTVIVRDTALYDMWQRGNYTEHTVEDAVRVCSEILPMFRENAIPVIRLGLNPTDELSSGIAAGGAYHPALGELVKSRIMRNKAEKIISESILSPDSLHKSGNSESSAGSRPVTENSYPVTIYVNPSNVSQMIGQHRCNIDYLKSALPLKSLKVKSDNTVLENDLRILYN